MFTELIDVLRCTASHEDTWLVAAAEQTDGRHIVAGRLGCPVCRAEYRIVNGVADFRSAEAVPPPDTPAAPVPTEDDVLRARALLNLVEDGGTIALVGGASALLTSLEHSAPAVYLLINPTAGRGRADVSILLFDRGEPLAAGVLRGALAEEPVSEPVLHGVARAVRVGGRLVAPGHLPVPPGIKEIARDTRHWVGERLPVSSAPVPLQRRQSSS